MSSTQIRMQLSIKVFFFLLICCVVANTCLKKNGKLTALEYQYSDSQAKCFISCFGSALQSHISHGHKSSILIRASLWHSTEARTLSGFDCTYLILRWYKINKITYFQTRQFNFRPILTDIVVDIDISILFFGALHNQYCNIAQHYMSYTFFYKKFDYDECNAQLV